MYQAWPGAFSGVFAARLRREGWAGIATTAAANAAGDCGGGRSGFDTQPVVLPTCSGSSSGGGGGGGSTQELQLRINAQTTVGGWMAVGLLNASTGVPVAGWSLSDAAKWTGNAIRKPVGWGGGVDRVDWELGSNAASGGADAVSYDLSPLAGMPVVLQVRLCRAQLWSWVASCITPQPSPRR